VREGLRRVIDEEPDFEVVAQASGGAEAVQRALAEPVDLAVLDVSMPRMTGCRRRAN
jgi:YesN/AraC family two-component response regulator